MLTRDQMRRLIDTLPDDQIPAASAASEHITDPVTRALLLAPEDDEPLTDEDIEALREAEEAIARGEIYTHSLRRIRPRGSAYRD